MAIDATRQVLQDGAKHCTMLFTGVCDGNGEDEINEPKVIVSELTPPCRLVSVESLEYEVSGGIVRILWDANDPKTFLDLASVGSFDFKKTGPVSNPNDLEIDGVSGNILFTTFGFDVGSSYSIKMTLVKKLNY